LDLYHLEQLCRQQRHDDFAVRDILFKHLGRNFECECKVLYEDRELQMDALKRQFGIDLESVEVGLLD
jgi:hypothetical protein